MRTAISVLGADIGKNVCSLVGLDAFGGVVLRRRVKRQTLIALVTKLPSCIVAMEACPYVKAQKNDDRDAEGIAEAATRPTMRFVELHQPPPGDPTGAWRPRPETKTQSRDVRRGLLEARRHQKIESLASRSSRRRSSRKFATGRNEAEADHPARS